MSSAPPRLRSELGLVPEDIDAEADSPWPEMEASGQGPAQTSLKVVSVDCTGAGNGCSQQVFFPGRLAADVTMQLA